METDTRLNVGIGTKESVSLKPAKLKILRAEIQPVTSTAGKAVGDKVCLFCKHPDKNEAIEISSVKFESKDGKLKTSGIWFKLDEDGQIIKGSALSVVLNFYDAANVAAMIGKEVDSVLDDSNYLAIKAY